MRACVCGGEGGAHVHVEEQSSPVTGESVLKTSCPSPPHDDSVSPAACLSRLPPSHSPFVKWHMELFFTVEFWQIKAIL